jgi:hypothetical protein
VNVGGGKRRLGSGLRPNQWAAFPTASAPRWWLPCRPGRGGRAALAIYQPVTYSGRTGWHTARIAATLGGLRLLPKADPPPLVQDVIVRHVPPGGQYAVMRANHPQRFVALVVDRTGRPAVVAKVALSIDGQHALAREASALMRLGQRLPAPLRAPAVVAHQPEILVTQAVEWRVRSKPWKFPAEVASSLGALFRATESAGVGVAHGDCAPWNLLSSVGSWVLVDWESATTTAPPFHDVFHYVVQSHALLGRPRADTILAGLDGRGWIGEAIHAYADASGHPVFDAVDHLLGYLSAQLPDRELDIAPHDPAADARNRLLSATERWLVCRTPRSTPVP